MEPEFLFLKVWHQAPAEASSTNEFLRPVRRYRAFRQGLDCSPLDRLPTTFERPYQLHLAHFPDRFLGTLRVAILKGMSLGSVLRHATGLMFAAALTVTFLRLSAWRTSGNSFSSKAMLHSPCFLEILERLKNLSRFTFRVTEISTVFPRNRGMYFFKTGSSGAIYHTLHESFIVALALEFVLHSGTSVRPSSSILLRFSPCSTVSETFG